MMSRWREKKRTMLAGVHQHFEIKAVYLTHATGVPCPVTVRLHRKQIIERPSLGSYADELAGMLDIHDRIIFQKSQLPNSPEGVLSRAYVIFSATEAYYTGPSKPEREGYIWVEVSEVPQAQLSTLISQVDLAHTAWLGVLP